MIGIGVDLVELGRFRETLTRTPGVVGRMFTDRERSYCERRRDPVERFAVRFAAKEAALKAMGIGLFNFPLTEIEVVRRDSGAPELLLHGRAAEMAAERGVASWYLTLTHTDQYAQAIAMAFAAGTAPPGGHLPVTSSLRIELFAADVSRTAEFYEDVFGFEPTGTDSGEGQDAAVTLVLGAIVLRVEAAAALNADHPARPIPGIRHGLGVEVVFEVPDIDGLFARAARRIGGIEPPVDRPWGQRDFRLVDPDGVYLRVTAPRSRRQAATEPGMG